MTMGDLGKALNLSVSEGWNQTEKDWRFLIENPDNVCIVAEKDNRVAGTATALIHSGKVAWIGMVLVDKALRGHGAGKMLMTDIITRLDRAESIKLDATPAGQPLYSSLGFKDEYNIFRMANLSLKSVEYKYTGDEPQNIKKDMLHNIVKKDTSVFGVERGCLINHLFDNYPERSFSLPEELNNWGYILGRNGTRYNYAGPLCAGSDESARSLLYKALSMLKNQPVVLDIPDDKYDMIKWLESTGFEKQRYFVRMYLGKNPYPGKPEFQYLIGGPEFG